MGKKKTEERTHALLSASSAKKWLHCTPSARLEDAIPDKQSEFAAEGTLAHSICELKLAKQFTDKNMTDKAYKARLGKLQKDPRYAKEMDGFTDAYLDYITGIAYGLPSPPYIAAEKRVDYSPWAPEGFGTCDCILIQGPEKTMVIDGGEADYAETIIGYLGDQGVTEIDYYLNTHPHADHYGGITRVMEAIPTHEFFHHPVPEEHTPTTRGYQKLLAYLAEHKGETKTTVLDPGDTLDLGGGAVLTILAPLEEYDDMNNNSLVGRLVFGETAFLFTGDAEKKSENAILASGVELSADVYSVPHHGSSTGMTKKFLEAVSPDYATISVGMNNDYGHPHRETVEKLSEAGIPCLRTDLDGNIVFISDGKELALVAGEGAQKKVA